MDREQLLLIAVGLFLFLAACAVIIPLYYELKWIVWTYIPTRKKKKNEEEENQN